MEPCAEHDIKPEFWSLVDSENVNERRKAARDLEIYVSDADALTEDLRPQLFDLLCQLAADLDKGVRELAGHALIRGGFISAGQFGLVQAYADPRVERIGEQLEWDMSGIVFRLAVNRLHSADENQQLEGIITLKKIAKYDRNYSLAAGVLKKLIINSQNPNLIISAMETLVLLTREHSVSTDSRSVMELLKDMKEKSGFVLRGMLGHNRGFFRRVFNGELTDREKKKCKKKIAAILGYTFDLEDDLFLDNLETMLMERHPLLVGRSLTDETIRTLQRAASDLLKTCSEDGKTKPGADRKT